MRRASGNGRFFVLFGRSAGLFFGSPLRHSAKRCATSPAGGGKRTCVNLCKVCGKAKLKKVRLTTKFSSAHGRELGSPSGGTNSDRVQRTKQGAVSGAALRFLQALTRARRKNRLSARGAGETPARAARLRGEQSGAPGPLRRLRRHLPRTRGRQEPKGCVLALPRAGELSSEARLRGLYTKLSPPCSMGANRAEKTGSKEKKAKTKK